ncbi:MAG: glycoside hydrolase family 17 [Alphaproteobacteria bacterium]
MRGHFPILGIIAAGLSIAAAWAWLGRPFAVIDAPPGKVHCVSYTPFRDRDTPFDPGYLADPRKIDEDLKLVATFSDCIRLYAADQGLAAAVPLAKKHGLKVLLGIWIGGNEQNNRMQLALALALAKEFRDTIKAVIVGNEVLLRGEQTPAAMAALARQVKQETGLPVTYADVTDFWLTAPRELADAVDFITIHILPYWEDQPESAGRGVDVVRSAVDRVQARFPDKPIFIGETGFPSKGRSREAAVPSLVAQAEYVRGFMAFAAQAGLDYNLIEAFDQPWKRLLEGTAGGFWGLDDTARTSKFSGQGPVSNHPAWRHEAAASFGIAVILLLAWSVAGAFETKHRDFLLGSMAGVGSTLLILQGEHSWAAWRDPIEFAVELLLFLSSATCLWLLPPEVAKDRDARAPAAIARCLVWLRTPRTAACDKELIFGLLRFAMSFAALVASVDLAFDPRYRDFPNAAFAFSAAGFAWNSFRRGDALRIVSNRREEAIFAVVLALATAIIFVNETPFNLEADLWCVICLATILPWSGAARGSYRDLTSPSSVSSNPIAPNSVL